MHRSQGLQGAERYDSNHELGWDGFLSLEKWLTKQPVHEWKTFFDENGYLVVEGLLEQDELKPYQETYSKMLSGEIDTSNHRHDLGNHVERKSANENVCQIMWPQLYVKGLKEGPLHKRSEAISKIILGDDMAFDFDMLIYKAPNTDTETPWHQDESYWPDLPDKRAVSCWVALDEATVENGCMWFVPGSFKNGVKPHKPVAEGVHILMCDLETERGLPVPLKPGSCTFHHGRTLHHTEGNRTDTHRRAYITNYRPLAMVEKERSIGYDHGKEGLKGVVGQGKTHQNAKKQDKAS